MNKGEFITLIGHSGCGKSTVLSMAAGLNEITRGGIVLDGQHVVRAGPERAVVFQAPSLLPWLSAFDNVALGVDRVYPDATKAERREVVGILSASGGLGGCNAQTCYRSFQWYEAARGHRKGHSRCRPNYCCSMSLSACLIL